MMACFPTPRLPPDYRLLNEKRAAEGEARALSSERGRVFAGTSAQTTLRTEGTTEVAGRMLRAGWHSIQIEALTILTERVASPKEVAVKLGLPVAKAGHVSYHIKELVKRGLVDLIRTEPRRGALEHFYGAIEPLVVMDNDAKRLSFEQRLIYSSWIINRINDDLLVALESGTIDQRTDRHLSRFPLRLDEEGYQAVITNYRDVFHRTREIQAESDDRLLRTGGVGKPFSAVLACFPMPRIW
jgi:hypothetical protein